MLSKIKKLSFSFLLIVFIFLSTVGTFVPQTAKAQFVVTEAASIPQTVKMILDKVWEGLKVGVLNVVTTAVSYGLRKIAYDSAVWVASGGKGQGALVFQKGFGDYIKDVGNDAVGQGIDSLQQKWGISLCKIPNPAVDLAIRQSLRLGIGTLNTQDPTRKPSCTLTQFYENNLSGDAWKSRYNAYSSSLSNQFNEALSPNIYQGELGIQIQAVDTLLQKIAQAKDAAAVDMTKGAGAKDLTDPVSGRIKLPADSVRTELSGISNKSRVEQAQSQINTAISTGEFKVLPGALGSFFLNTLAGTMLKNFQEKGILPFGIGCVGSNCPAEGTGSVTDYDGAGGRGGRRIAQEFFNEFLTAQPKTVDQYNILGELSNCPDAPNLYNCRADDGLIQAAQEFSNGAGVTLREAIDKGMLHGDWKIIPPIRTDQNGNKECYQDAYCFSNIKVLRQLRILPLGFEIAAQQSDPDKPWTLKQVVDGFTDCEYIKNGQGQVVGVNYSPNNKPFCHLIDPNWVIKAPATRCGAQVYGSGLLSSDAPDRLQDCADLSSCVAYNKDGTCINYGYCTREKNVWKFNADSCGAQFRTCKSFTDSSGNSASYVSRSLDSGSCTKDNVGCKTYTFSQNNNGSWQNPGGPDPAADYVNNGIYFDKNISTSCGANSAGCSAYKIADSPTDLLYLKQAPDYLKCYDTNPATAKIDWPKTVSDLTKLQINQDPDCEKYAGACIEDELNCNWYSLVKNSVDSEKIPGRYSQDDVCDAKCVGYDTYRELPNNYSNGQSIAYIIPSSGKTCVAEEEGCSAFTNLSTDSGGLEKVEYFSYLRPCITPDVQKQKTFITYEGSVNGGFQLKTFNLVKDSVGGPQYFYRTADDLTSYQTICSESSYKNGSASLDCRQFNDESGKVYYRLLSKTIPVSDSCTPYRLSDPDLQTVSLDQQNCSLQKGFWNNGSCQVCFQNGEYRDGSCFYYGLPENVANSAGKSTSCSQGVESCRAYKGNAGNNVREVFIDTFENTAALALAPWKGKVFISLESTRVGEHSLNYAGSGDVSRSMTLNMGKSYDVTFWAKGSGQALKVSLKSADGSFVKDFGVVGTGDTWNYYHLGPVDVAGATTTVDIVFSNQVNGRLFLDNVNVKEVNDLLYLVKNSLRIDSACDSNVNDNLPGEALGCRAYQDPNKNQVNLTGFSHLCREGAIGCTSLLNTQNTIEDSGPRAYNVWLAGQGNSKAEIIVDKDVYDCQILPGQNGCYVNIFGHEAAEILAVNKSVFVTSTVFIPHDTPTSSPLYLVANKEASCNAVDLGCSYAGTENANPVGPRFVTTTVKNDPAFYQDTLCQQQAVGCSVFSGSSGDSYFKDPVASGQKICSYRKDVLVNNVNMSGWFWKGVGVCSNDKSKNCTANKDCTNQGTCQNINEVPCYSNYVVQGNEYGLWSSGDTGKYQNSVGECPLDQNQCTEFVDHNDGNKAYYFLNNEKLSSGNCDGLVSQREGCALFDQTDNPNKYWLTKDSYSVSEQAQFAPVKPVEAANNTPGDANKILKVQLDRECGEWLQCRSSYRVWDTQSGKWKSVCEKIGRCKRAPENSSEDSVSNCAEWADDSPIYTSQVLDEGEYVKRDVSWKGMDFAGYSLLNFFPLESLSQINFSVSATKPDWRLAHMIPCGDTNCAVGADPDSDVSCKTNGFSCGKGGEGICINSACVQKVDGTVDRITEQSPTQICRAYPEKDSPFPNSIFIDKAKSQFERANLCGETVAASADKAKAYACDCDYTKVNYGEAITKYWKYDAPNTTEESIKGVRNEAPAGICLGGSHDAAACESDLDCFKTKTGKPDGAMAPGPDGNKVSDGSCQKSKGEIKLLGWKGFCLEYDESRNINGEQNRHPCLTWLPVDHLAGTSDLNNQHEEASYQPPATSGSTGGAYYCLVGSSAGKGLDPQSNFYPLSTKFIARGETSTLDIDSDKDGDNQFARKTFAATPEEAKFSQLDIENIELKVRNPDSEDPESNTLFQIWPNDPLTPKNSPQGKFTIITKNHSNEYGTAVTGKFLGQDNQLILMYGSKVKDTQGDTGGAGYVNKDGGVCYPSVTNGGVVGQYSVDEGACQDLGGNVFSGLKSQHKGVNTQVPLDGTDPLNGDKLGIWDPAFNADDICGGYNGAQGNWHALRIKFDPVTRKFAGYDMAYCDQSSGSGHISYTVTFNLREWCPVIVDATNDPTSPDQNSAPWTNRLWKDAKPQYVLRAERNADLNFFGLNYDYGFDYAPFGSLGLNKLNRVYDPVVITPFQKIKDDYCQPGRPGIFTCEIANSIKSEPGDQEFRSALFGAPYSCPGGSCVRADSTGKLFESDAAGYSEALGGSFINQLFARINKIFTFDTSTNKDSSQYVGYKIDTNKKPIDTTDTVNAIPKVPWIFPAINCDEQGRCVEDDSAPGFTVNNTTNGDVRIPLQSGRVFLRFFAFADPDQMPLRNVRVVWGDESAGEQVQGLAGLFRNHRGYAMPTCVSNKCFTNQIDDTKTCRSNTDCGVNGKCVLTAPGSTIGKCLVSRDLGASCTDATDCPLNPTCVEKEKANNFGQILDKTCDNNFIQFSHVYSCLQGAKGWEADSVKCDGKAANLSAFPRGCCVFVPSVQVTDNWGWCNGKCGIAGSPGGLGCFDGSYKNGTNECKDSLKDASVPFKGKIILAPPVLK